MMMLYRILPTATYFLFLVTFSSREEMQILCPSTLGRIQLGVPLSKVWHLLYLYTHIGTRTEFFQPIFGWKDYLERSIFLGLALRNWHTCISTQFFQPFFWLKVLFRRVHIFGFGFKKLKILHRLGCANRSEVRGSLDRLPISLVVLLSWSL